MVKWLVKQAVTGVSWQTFAAGAATAVIGGVIARPVLVGMVKAGITVPKVLNDAWNQAKEDVAKARSEHEAKSVVSTPSNSEIFAELQALRAENAKLRAEIGSVNPS